jgi:polysaccharide biosynthesis/export protein
MDRKVSTCRFWCEAKSFPLLCAMLACFAAYFGTSSAQAQSVQLTSEQQRLLSQLPPSQRDAAMRQLRQFSARSVGLASSNETTDRSEKEKSDDIFGEVDVDEEVVPHLEPESTVIVSVVLPPNAVAGSTDAVATRGRTEMIQRIRSRNPYKLDEFGRLNLPGIAPIFLAGLTEDQATARLQSDIALEGIDTVLTLLPLSPVGVKALEPYGYDLFERNRRQGEGSAQVPVPANYAIGPGDLVRIQLFGNRNAEYEVPVERDGTIQIPEIGPIVVSGFSFEQLRDDIRQLVSKQLIGTQASVSLGELRSIQVFLVGDVNKPGAYTVGSLSTMTHVLSAGGGVAPHGSLRSIQLKRGGAAIANLDVYDLLMRGDTRDDARVQSGDVVFVPPVGKRVSVSGDVKRPAIYEFRGSATVADALELAGGVLPSALGRDIKIERVQGGDGIETLDANLSNAGGSVLIRDGDKVYVPRVPPAIESSVVVEGNVYRPGPTEWRPGLRLSDVIESSRSLKPTSDLNYVLIRREPVANAGPTVLSASLRAAWQMKGGPVDLELMPRDTIYVFDLDVGRSHITGPLIEELQLRSTKSSPLPVVTIGGSVNAPGEFPMEAGMTIADLVRAGGGLAQSAYTDDAELTRYEITSSGERDTRVISIDLARALDGDQAANFELQSFDYLNIREVPSWSDKEFVELLGEVRFPGRYPIKRGESLSSVVSRAGGPTELAFTEGAVFTRAALKLREKDQMDILASRIEQDLATLSISGGGPSDAQGIGQSLLAQLRSFEPVGRLVIDLGRLINERSADGIAVRDGDILRIPRRPQEVTVIGEVQYATSHVFRKGFDRDDYIERSGGTTAKADKKRIYVVRANGEVLVGNSSRFFRRSGQTEIHAGDTIVVPLDTDRIRPLVLWTSATQIVYNLAIAAAAVAGF